MQNLLHALDPASSADVDAIRSLFHRRRGSFEPELQALARRVHEESADRLLRVDALNVLASAAVVAGDDDAGCRRFRAALDLSWGTGTHAERVACVNLAMIVARQRRLVEALALSRRACGIALRHDEPLGACLAHAQLAKTLLELGDHEGFRRAVELAVVHRPDMDATLAGWVPHLLAGLRAEVALQDGDFAEADRLMAQALDGAETPREVIEMGRAAYLRRIGRIEDALEVVRGALAGPCDEPCYRLRFQGEELLCLVELGDREALIDRASLYLGEMASAGRKCGSATWRMRVGETVALALSGDASTHAQARQALELAALAALERDWEAQMFFRQFPQLERMEPDDLAVLEAHAERFAAKHRELLCAIRSLLRGDAHREASLRETDACDLYVCICAWCHCVRGPERVWIPIERFAAASTEIDVTHGICDACRERVKSAGRVATG